MKIDKVLNSDNDYLIVNEDDKIIGYVDNKYFEFIENDKNYAQFVTINKWGGCDKGTYFYFDFNDNCLKEGLKLLF